MSSGVPADMVSPGVPQGLFWQKGMERRGVWEGEGVCVKNLGGVFKEQKVPG